MHTLISASTGGSLILWDPRVPAKLVHHAPRAHNDAIAGLQFDEHKVVRSGLDSFVLTLTLTLTLSPTLTVGGLQRLRLSRQDLGPAHAGK